MYIGRPTHDSHFRELAALERNGSFGHAGNASGGGAPLGAYPQWPTGPYNGARGLGAVSSANCAHSGNATIRTLQVFLNEKLAEHSVVGDRLVVDGYFCCGRGSKGAFTGSTYNALSWWVGPGRGRLSMSARDLLTLARSHVGQPAAPHVPIEPEHVSEFQTIAGVEPDGCWGMDTEDAHAAQHSSEIHDDLDKFLPHADLPGELRDLPIEVEDAAHERADFSVVPNVPDGGGATYMDPDPGTDTGTDAIEDAAGEIEAESEEALDPGVDVPDAPNNAYAGREQPQPGSGLSTPAKVVIGVAAALTVGLGAWALARSNRRESSAAA